MVSEIESAFPNLGKYDVTSPRSDEYNCKAWAAGMTDAWWWPDEPKAFWPPGVSAAQTVEAFREAYSTLGYDVCVGDELEAGFQRIALFADSEHVPTHAARQLSSGRWTSKLGLLEDIEHDLYDLEGEAYGKIVLIMKRELPRD